MADFVAKVGWLRWTVAPFVWSSRHWSAGPDALYATPTLRNTQGPSGWWPSNQRSEPSQVLGDGGQNKLILGASWTAESKPAELQDALQVRKPHLDLLALAPRLLKVLGANERSGDVAGTLMDCAGPCVMASLGSTVIAVRIGTARPFVEA